MLVLLYSTPSNIILLFSVYYIIQCQVSVGPLPQGTYTLGNMYTFKGMPYCYDLYPSSSNNMCGRSGFLIHGGGCSGNPSEGCIVIEDQNVRYKIKSGATLHVVA